MVQHDLKWIVQYKSIFRTACENSNARKWKRESSCHLSPPGEGSDVGVPLEIQKKSGMSESSCFCGFSVPVVLAGIPILEESGIQGKNWRHVLFVDLSVPFFLLQSSLFPLSENS